MIKRCITGLLAVILSFGMAASAFAETPGSAERMKFLAAVKVTFDELKREKEISKKYSDVSAVIDSLTQKSYEYLVEAAMNVSDGGDKMRVEFKNTLIADNETGRMLDTVEADVGQIIGMGTKVGASFYMDDNMIAVRLPGVNPAYYYYIKANTTVEQWNNSPIGKEMPLTEDDMNAFKTYISLAKKQGETMAAKPPKDMMDKYAAITAKYMAGGMFRSEGNAVVEANRGFIGTEKITCYLSAAAVNNYFEELAKTVEKDEQLRAYLGQAGASFDDLGYSLADDTIKGLAEFLRSGFFDSGLKYSVYISGTGYAVRQELAFDYEDSLGDISSAVLGMNLMGTDYLLNETKLTAETTCNHETGKITLSVDGDVVPKNGVFDSKITFKNVYSDSGEGEDVSVAFMNFKWDTNAKTDNFLFDMVYKGNVDKNTASIAKTDKEAARFELAGDVTLDKAANVFAANFKNINFKYEDYDIAFDLKIAYKPAEQGVASIPENRTVNALSLTQEELEKLTSDVMGAFMGS